MRLGQVFNETVIYARQWVTVDTAKWWPLPGRRPTLRIMKHCQEMAHWWVYEEGQHVLLYQFTFRFHQYTAGTDSLAFSSASTVTVNPYCRCFTCKGCHLLVRKWLFFFFFLFHIQRNLIPCSIHASQAILMGLMEGEGALDRICNGAEPPLILLELFRLHHRLPDCSKIRLVYKHMVHRLI